MAAKKTAPKKSSKPETKAKAPRVTPGATAEILTRTEVPDSSIGSDSELRKKLREFSAQMNTERRVRAMADEAPNVYELRRPTGIMQLDIDIGGGFPAGGLSIASGPDNAGKTWLCLRTMAMHQRLYGQKSCLAFATAEVPYDYKRALSAGLVLPIPDEMIREWNQERLNLGMPGYTDQDILWFKRKVGEFTILRGHTGEELMNVVLEAVKKNIFGIIAVDSFSVLLPEADEEKDVGGTPKRAGNANLMTDFIKKYTPYTSGLHERNETSLIGIMQVRANAAKADAGHLAKYLKDWAVTGAYATRHGKLVDITVWGGSPLKKTVQGQQVVYGKPFYWKIEKGKAGCHDNVQGETEFRYDIPHGHDDIWGLIVNGTRRGIFVEEKKKIQIYHPVTKTTTDLGGFPSFPAFGRVIAEDFEFELQMRLYVLAAAGVQCLYRPLA